MKNVAVVILAAGKSTRMKSSLSKVLHRIAGRAVVSYPVELAAGLSPKKIVVVVGPGQREAFEERLGKMGGVEYCIQREALGTGHAVKVTEKHFKDFDGNILIIPGDVPLIWKSTIYNFVENVVSEDAVCSIISTRLENPFSYGRIIRDEFCNFRSIREEKDASNEEKEIDEINSGIYMVSSKWLYKSLKKIKPANAQKEYYLTDIIEMAVCEGEKVTAHCYEPGEQFLGINDRNALSGAGKLINNYINAAWMEKGVSIVDPEQTYIDADVTIGNDTIISPFVSLRGKTVIGKNCLIDVGSVMEDAVIDDGVHIKPYSIIEKSRVKSGSVIGPFSRLRPETVIEKDVKVGNFVEIKKSHLKKGVKASHLTYLGDSTIGAGTNVGCGTITCNYDGRKKHKTIVGKNVLIGSDVQFVAPVKIGSGAVIGAGTTVTRNVPPGTLALSRVPQVNIKGYSKKVKSKGSKVKEKSGKS